MISLQEELDWQLLAAYGLASDDLPVLGEAAPPIALGQRAFEIVLARQVAAGADRNGMVRAPRLDGDHRAAGRLAR